MRLIYVASCSEELLTECRHRSDIAFSCSLVDDLASFFFVYGFENLGLNKGNCMIT